MKILKNKFKCINLFVLSCLFGLILNTPSFAKGIKFEQLPFDSAIKAISETYGINVFVTGEQPKVDVTLELNNDSITKDIRKIVSYCGINNYILFFDDKNCTADEKKDDMKEKFLLLNSSLTKHIVKTQKISQHRLLGALLDAVINFVKK